MTRDMAESPIPAILATSAPTCSTAILLGKRQRSATGVKASLGNSFHYLDSKLFKFTCTYNEVNSQLKQDIKAIVEEDNTNIKAIMLHMLATIAGSLYTLFQAYLKT